MAELLNIFLHDTLSESSYKSKPRPVTYQYPVRHNPAQHGAMLLAQYAQAKARSQQQYTPDQVAAIKAKDGCYFDISGLPGKKLLIDSLEQIKSGIRLCNVQEIGEDDEKETIATVFVPTSKEHLFVKKLQEYAKGIQDGKRKPANDDLVRSIEHIRAAVVQSLWTDKKELFPTEDAAWCELWLRAQKGLEETVRGDFLRLCEKLEIPSKDEYLVFPERVVCVAFVSGQQLGVLFQNCDSLAEIRRVAELNSFFVGLSPREQKEWSDELLGRLDIRTGNTAICILDTGVNSEHPLLKPLYAEGSVLKAREYMASGADQDGHGTQMAGIAGYGDFKKALISSDPVIIQHSLESVKLLGSRGNEPALYGDYTKRAISFVEIARPTTKRAICLAVTASPTAEKGDGRPSSWSAAIDALAAGVDDGTRRLILISAGNVNLEEYNDDGQVYPEASVLHSVEDPAQAWNALAVGAYTAKTEMDMDIYTGYHPLAATQNLSPYSSTSRIWSQKWPVKPDILCEGGNAIINDEGTVDACDDLNLLTTHHRPTERLFTTIGATSAAVANASWMAAQIMSQYPECWPETVRGLMVASARWSDEMCTMFCRDFSKKRDVQKLLRACGYGIANLERARFCAENAVNMIIEAELTPFNMRNHYCGFGQMHLHELPWPREYLLEMGEMEVELKVVLSYFIEPGPGAVGFNNRYRYPSCGLRFDVNNPNETKEQFERRINQQMQDMDDSIELVANDTGRWYIGPKGRTTGSLHCDIWQGTAAELSEANLIAVYPTSGWWKTRQYLKRYDSKVRYSLVVTLSTPQVETQLYTQITNKIGITIPITPPSIH